MKIRMLTLAVVVAVAGIAQAAPLVPAHLPSDAKWVIHVNLEQVRSSDLVEPWREKWEKHERVQEKIKEATEKMGLNPMKDLLGATVYDTKYGRHNGVALIHLSKSDPKKMVALFEKKHPDHKTTKVGDRTIYSWKVKSRRHGEHGMAGTFANDNTIVLSRSVDEVKNALAVIDGKSKAMAADGDLVDGLAKKSMMVARAIDVDPEYMKVTRCPVLKRCTSATVQWLERKGNLVGRYAFETESEDTAKDFKAVVDGLKGLAALRFGSDKEVSKVLDGLNAKAKGKELNITFKASTEDILTAAKKHMGKHGKRWHKHGHKHHHKDKDHDHKHDKKSDKEEI